MPYIAQARRQALGTVLEDALALPENAGELNYVFSKFIDSYLADEGLSYATINEVVGVLECAKLELYRRVAAPYEDDKAMTNGDVFESAGDSSTGVSSAGGSTG